MFEVKSVYCLINGPGQRLDGYFRVVMALKRSNYVYLFPLSITDGDLVPDPDLSQDTSMKAPATPVRKPVPIWRQELETALANGLAKKIDVVEFHGDVVPYEQMKKTDQEVYDRNQIILRPVTSPDILFEMLEHEKWAYHVARVANALSVSELMVRRLWSKYFQVGMDLHRACASARPNCGRTPGKDRKVTTKLGRPRDLVKTGHAPDKVGVNSLEYMLDIELFYNSLSDKTLSYQEQFKRFEERFYAQFMTSLADGTLVRKADQAKEFITDIQYTYRLKQIIGQANLKKAYTGSRRYALENRVLIGEARDAIHFPGQVYIIDSTVADVYLVSAYDRSLLIGRPVIYVVIDAFSLLIVAVHVALEGPSFEQARIALYRAMTDKSSWLEWLGLNGLKDAFPHGCRPTFVLADRGELHSLASRELAEDLKYALSIAAPYRADWKSLVERFFKVLNDEVIHWMPGAVRERARDRGDRDVRFDAVLTLYEFTRVIAIECAMWNRYKDLSKYVTAPMLPYKFEASPTAFWKWGLENLHGSADLLQRDDALVQFMPHFNARITQQGIFVDKDRYVDNWMTENPVMIGKGLGLKADGILFKDPDHPLKAYCKFDRDSQLRLVHLKNADEQMDDPLTYEDIVDFRALNALNGKERELDTKPEVSALSSLQNEIIQNATLQTKIAHQENPQSKRKRTTSTRENRRNEVAGTHAEKMSPVETGAEANSDKEIWSANEDLLDLINAEVENWEAA
jgi:hypothetical protein